MSCHNDGSAAGFEITECINEVFGCLDIQAGEWLVG